MRLRAGGGGGAWEASQGGWREKVGWQEEGSSTGTINQRERELLPSQGASETLGRSRSSGGAGLMAAIGVPQRDFLCPLAVGQAAA